MTTTIGSARTPYRASVFSDRGVYRPGDSTHVVAIVRGHWSFHHEGTTGVVLGGVLPIEEVLFFVAIPLCALLTYETVRRMLRDG